MSLEYSIRDILPEEFEALGALMVDVYSSLPGFPGADVQPAYYEMLAGIGGFSRKPATQVLVAVAADGALLGGVVYFSDMAQYGAGGTAGAVKNASGIRLLGVDPATRGLGVGKALALACIERARTNRHAEVVLHTTKAMQLAWAMYERLGFVRSDDLDFSQGALTVYGFRLRLA
jgi:ribosomal protein S18 acetylase RimI-like enzyme